MEYNIFDAYDDGTYLWYVPTEYNALLRLKKNTLEVEYMGSFPDEEAYGNVLYTSVLEYNGNLFFIPGRACEVGVYNIYNKHFKKINIGISFEQNKESSFKSMIKFVSGYIYEDTLVLIPCSYNYLIRYDLLLNQMVRYEDLFITYYNRYKELCIGATFQLCWFSKQISSEVIVFNLQRSKNIIIYYNLKTNTYTEKAIGDSCMVFGLIEQERENIWLYDLKSDFIVVYNQKNAELKKIKIKERINGFQPKGKNCSFANMVHFGEWIYLLQSRANYSIRVHKETLEVETVLELSTKTTKDRFYLFNTLCKKDKNRLWLSMFEGRKIITYLENGEMSHIKAELPLDAEKNVIMLGRTQVEEIIWNENVETNLNGYIEVVCANGFSFEQSKDKGETQGSKIYNLLR